MEIAELTEKHAKWENTEDLDDSSDDDLINSVLQGEVHFPQPGDSSSTSLKIEGVSNEGTAIEVRYSL